MEHPDSRFFDFLNGKTDAAETRSIEEHLSGCEACKSAAALVRGIKDAIAESATIAGSDQHPAVSELASFFYDRSTEEVSSPVAVHVARCASCADAIAQYAAGERAASTAAMTAAASREVPTSAWEMIRDWEESSFAKLKPASETLSPELLNRLPRILKEHGESPDTRDAVSQPSVAERVPILVISRSGDVQSVEYFEESIEAPGTRVLRHSEGSTRFDNRVVHMLFGAGEKEAALVSEPIKSDTLRFEEIEWVQDLRRAGYFIIED